MVSTCITLYNPHSSNIQLLLFFYIIFLLINFIFQYAPSLMPQICENDFEIVLVTIYIRILFRFFFVFFLISFEYKLQKL